MNDFESQLETIDEQLKGYTHQQRWLIYIGSALGILLMGWMFYISDALDELTLLDQQNSTLTQQIADNSPEAFRTKIAKVNQSILREETRTKSLEADKQALLLQMEATQGLIFDNRHYAKMLDLLLEQSVRLGLKIELMESEDLSKPYFGKVSVFKKLTITGTGNFPSIADFLTFIESQNTLVQIESVQISTDGTKPRFQAVILYMGVAL